jgi:hypothetical protein
MNEVIELVSCNGKWDIFACSVFPQEMFSTKCPDSSLWLAFARCPTLFNPGW